MEQGCRGARTDSYVYLGQRLVRGWAIEIVLVAMLLPFLAAAVDLFARCRRAGSELPPRFGAIAAGSGSGPGSARCSSSSGRSVSGEAATSALPHLRLLAGGSTVALVLLAGAGWLVARSRLLPRRPSPEERLAGHSGALLALGVVGLLVAATNPSRSSSSLPSLHAWLWLPQVQTRHPALRAGVLLVGFLGPAYLV